MTKDARPVGTGIIIPPETLKAKPSTVPLESAEGECCGGCGNWVPVPGGDEQQGTCHAAPPKTLIIPTPPRIQGMMPETITFSAWPPVGRHQWCAAWHPARRATQ